MQGDKSKNESHVKSSTKLKLTFYQGNILFLSLTFSPNLYLTQEVHSHFNLTFFFLAKIEDEGTEKFANIFSVIKLFCDIAWSKSDY